MSKPNCFFFFFLLSLPQCSCHLMCFVIIDYELLFDLRGNLESLIWGCFLSESISVSFVWELGSLGGITFKFLRFASSPGLSVLILLLLLVPPLVALNCSQVLFLAQGLLLLHGEGGFRCSPISMVSAKSSKKCCFFFFESRIYLFPPNSTFPQSV